MECRTVHARVPRRIAAQDRQQPAPVVEVPPLAPGAAPLCYVVDEDASIRQFLSLVLHGSGIDTVEFADGAALRQVGGKARPDLVFHNVALDSADALEFAGHPRQRAAFAAPCN